MTKYKTIVIDPPWDLKGIPHMPKTRGTGKGKVLEQKISYDLMTDKQITEFPIDDFADKDCALFMWTIHKKLPIALDIIKSWNFKYVCVITWHKLNGRVGNTAAAVVSEKLYRNSELLIYARRGNRTLKNTIRFVYSAPNRGHSQKPSEIYQSLRQSTSEPRIDIFARRQHEGFDAYGNQIEPVLQTTLGDVHDDY